MIKIIAGMCGQTGVCYNDNRHVGRVGTIVKENHLGRAGHVIVHFEDGNESCFDSRFVVPVSMHEEVVDGNRRYYAPTAEDRREVLASQRAEIADYKRRFNDQQAEIRELEKNLENQNLEAKARHNAQEDELRFVVMEKGNLEEEMRRSEWESNLESEKLALVNRSLFRWKIVFVVLAILSLGFAGWVYKAPGHEAPGEAVRVVPKAESVSLPGKRWM